MTDLAERALAKLQKGSPNPASAGAGDVPMGDALDEVWAAVKADDPKAFSEAMRNTLQIAANTK